MRAWISVFYCRLQQGKKQFELANVFKYGCAGVRRTVFSLALT